MHSLYLVLVILVFWVFLTWCGSREVPSMEVQDVQGIQDVPKEQDLAIKDNWYQEYSEWEFEKNQIAWNTSILFFTSPECAWCESLHNDIINNITKIPDAVSIYSVLLDDNKQLAKKYRVTSAHSLVIVHDKNNFTVVSNLTTLDKLLWVSKTQTITIK